MTKVMRLNEGKCSFCNQLFLESNIVEHLQSCDARSSTLEKEKFREEAKVFGIKVWATYAPSYWLYLEANGDALLEDLDQFLRNIWLECCGHLSAFTIGRETYQSGGDAPGFIFGESGGDSMEVRLSKVLSRNQRFHYEYDFGSTTELDLKVLWERAGKLAKKKVLLLSRNESSAFKCVSCGNGAQLVCSQCVSDGKAWYCRRCISKHDCGDEMSLPIVNSPRMGVCGYDGNS